MANGFNVGTYEIYWYKDQVGTPNTPQSPTTSIAQSPVDKSFNLKKSAIVATGAEMESRAFNTVRTEMLASTGNERISSHINNAMKGLGYIGVIAATGLTGAALITFDTTLSTITYLRENRRQNIALAIDRELKGKRVNIASGSAYYD